MMIVPALQAIPFAPKADEYFEKLDGALKGGGKIISARFRYNGSPMPLEPKIDFKVLNGDQVLPITVLYGPRTLAVIESNNITVEGIPNTT